MADLISYTQRQFMLRKLGGNTQAVIDDGTAEGLTVYCIFYNPGETADIANGQIIVTNPSILVDRDDVYVSSEWKVESGDPGTDIEVNSTAYTTTNRLPDDAGFVLLELTEA